MAPVRPGLEELGLTRLAAAAGDSLFPRIHPLVVIGRGAAPVGFTARGTRRRLA
ncbi:hypothetical protein [Streptomyces sp. NPDC051677]|uniref:hypothetical protein n=1 Tax=Streptomyces sp. NPDC051677 TaxID=3365669 RepID=UPI0037D85361